MAKTLFDIREEAELMEKLRASDPTGKWISDFVHSDNPKFAGKSKKERIRMALGAAYGAKKEEVELDEAIKLNSKVVIHAPGKSYHGKVGHVGEIRHGAFKGAPKTYTVDHEGGSTQLDKKNIKLHKEETEIDEAAWGNDKLANLQAAHARHSEKAIQANKVGDHEAVKVHMSKMNSIKNQMNKIKQNEDVNLDEAGGMKSAALVKAMQRKQKHTAAMSPEKQQKQRQEYQDKKQNEDYYVKVNNALKTTPSGAHIMKFPTRDRAEQHAKDHKKRNPSHQVSVTNVATSNAAVWHGGTRTRPYAMAEDAVNEMSNVVFDNSGDMQGVTAGSIKAGAGARPAHLIKPEKDAAARARSLKHKEKKMKTEAKSLYDRHQELRKKSGLPDPSHYLKLAKQKQAEIDAMKADQGSTERLHTAAPEPHPGAQKTFTALRNKT